MLLTPSLSLFNEFLATVLLTLTQTLQVLLGDIWRIFPVHKVVLCYRYMYLSEFLIDPSSIPEYLLGLEIVNLLRLVLFHILYGLLEREPVRVEANEEIAPVPLLRET
jgi:hypothetical protein